MDVQKKSEKTFLDYPFTS